MSDVLTYNFEGKKVLIRVDFNVPLDENRKVTDSTRVFAALPTIKKVLESGGKVILMSHLGRPKGKDEKYSLQYVVPELEKALDMKVQFAPDCIGKEVVEMKNNLKNGEVLLLENLRFYKEETKGDEQFAKQLAEGVDVYINDAFATAHRAHASTSIIASNFGENKMLGLLLTNEIENLNKALTAPKKGYVAIIGGAKVSSKIIVINQLLEKVETLIVGGAMAYTFIKANGGSVGNSLVEDDYLDTAREVLKVAKSKGARVILPVDSVNADSFSNDANVKITSADKVDEGWMGMDIGDKTISELKQVLSSASTILWNGPVGVFEMPKFAKGTNTIAQLIVDATQNGAYSLVGGGDSVSALNKAGLNDKVSYVSTGGGAMLEYIEGKKLPGIEAI